jgi:lincosamide nucleotidyltransferase A/C/D/E
VELFAGMTAADVHAVLDALALRGCPVWVGGGWGVDALVGRQTRAHRDLDLALDTRREGDALAALAGLDYVIETDWRPVRVELGAPGGRWVDLHPLVFDEIGNGVQAGLGAETFRYPAECFVGGTIAGRSVGCLSTAQQLAFHSGYEPRPIDLTDIAHLRNLLAASDVRRTDRES